MLSQSQELMTLDSLPGACWFSRYWQVQMENSDNKKKDLPHPMVCLYQFRVMAFGPGHLPETDGVSPQRFTLDNLFNVLR